jgi:hemoglobin
VADSTLYERLGGTFPIAAVVDHFSDAIISNPIVGQSSENSAFREWHTDNLARLPGLKFDEVAAELARTLDYFQVPDQEKEEVLGAFAAHKGEVTEGYVAA